MHNREKTLNHIIKWAEGNTDVRAMLLTSSLVNPHAPVDRFSDLDIEIIFEENGAYVLDAAWLAAFGDPIAIIEEDEAAFDGIHAMKMVLYKDHVKVDFKLFSKEKFLVECKRALLPEDWDIGYKVLLDKDGLTTNMRPPSYNVSIIKNPSAARFQQVINDFWWDTTYVAKCLARGDIFYAKFMSENMIRTDYIVPLLEWYIASSHGWNITTNKHGRLFRRYLEPDLWHKIEKTFSGSDMAENWNALYQMADLVHLTGSALAEKLGYGYPGETEANVRMYLAEVQAGV